MKEFLTETFIAKIATGKYEYANLSKIEKYSEYAQTQFPCKFRTLPRMR